MTETREKVQQGYRLPTALIEQVAILAARKRVRPCHVVEEAIRLYLDRCSTIDRFEPSSN